VPVETVSYLGPGQFVLIRQAAAGFYKRDFFIKNAPRRGRYLIDLIKLCRIVTMENNILLRLVVGHGFFD
jgi:hypothetical protein